MLNTIKRIITNYSIIRKIPALYADRFNNGELYLADYSGGMNDRLEVCSISIGRILSNNLTIRFVGRINNTMDFVALSKEVKISNDGSDTLLLIDGEKYNAESDEELIRALKRAKSNPDKETRL